MIILLGLFGCEQGPLSSDDPSTFAITTVANPTEGGSTSGGGQYEAGTTVTVTASPAIGYTFIEWLEGGTAVFPSDTYEFVAGSDRSLVAVFSPQVTTLTITGGGNGQGTVTSIPGGINCTLTTGSASGDCSADFESGTSVTLTASAGTGQGFNGWSGACDGTGPCIVSMTQSRDVTAAFAVSGSQAPFAGKRILWVGAHPDDEVRSAPILAEACLHAGAECTLLVTTKGGAYCRYSPPAGLSCAEARAAEMVEAADILGASLLQWDLPNGSQNATVSAARSAWSQAAGSQQALVGSVRSAIEAVNPEVIVTFDPRHGTTCHPEHRLVSELVLQALEDLGPQQQPILRWQASQYSSGTIEGRVVRDAGGTVYALNANRPLPGGSGTYWSYLLAVIEAHRTQYSAADAAQAGQIPPEHRVLYLLEPGPDIDASVDYCSG